MTLKELLFSALSKADEEPGDDIIDQVALDAVNHGYKIVATTVDKQIDVVELNYADKIMLPDNFHSVVRLKCNGVQLSNNDFYISGSYLFITNKDFMEDTYKFDLLYVYYPNDMVDETDVPITRDSFDYLIIMYGAYNVLLYKKRYNMASMLFNEFMSMVGGDRVEL